LSPGDSLIFVVLSLLAAALRRALQSGEGPDKAAVRALIEKHADVNVPQVDGTPRCTGPYTRQMWSGEPAAPRGRERQKRRIGTA